MKEITFLERRHSTIINKQMQGAQGAFHLPEALCKLSNNFIVHLS